LSHNLAVAGADTLRDIDARCLRMHSVK